MSLWDIYQHVQIKNVQVSQRFAEQEQRFRDRRHEQDLDHVDDRLRQLTTMVEALWTLCRDKLGLTDDQLTAAVEAVVAEQQAELRYQARKRGVSISALVREAVDRELGRDESLDEAWARALSVIGKYQGGPPYDVAENHDEHLAEAFKDW